MPEMRFVVRWPDETVTACYSPSLIVREYLAVGQTYPVATFAALCREALSIASRRVEEKYGFPCSLAAAELTRIDTLAERFDASSDFVRVEGFQT